MTLDVPERISANAFDLMPYFKHLDFIQFAARDISDSDAIDDFTFEGNPLDASVEPEWGFRVTTYVVPSGTSGGHDFLVDFVANTIGEHPAAKRILLTDVTFQFNHDPAVTLEKIKRILQYLVNCLEMPYT